jgi:hypothetical protein
MGCLLCPGVGGMGLVGWGGSGVLVGFGLVVWCEGGGVFVGRGGLGRWVGLWVSSGWGCGGTLGFFWVWVLGWVRGVSVQLWGILGYGFTVV